MDKKVMPIKTKRLILREIEEEDTTLIVQLRSVPEVYKYFFSPKPITIEEHREWYFNHYMKDKNRIDFIAVEKNLKKIGVFSLKRCMEDTKCVEIGYLLDKNAQGNGYAQEVIRRLMLFTKDNWQCKEAVLKIHEENKASLMLAHRLGYQKKLKQGSFFLYCIDLTLFGAVWGGEDGS